VISTVIVSRLPWEQKQLKQLLGEMDLDKLNDELRGRVKRSIWTTKNTCDPDVSKLLKPSKRLEIAQSG